MNNIKATLLSREVLPFYVSLTALALVSLSLDALLHVFDLVWIGRYLGIPGTLLIIFSFAYSLRKRQLIKSGTTLRWLRLHERMAWTGSLLILVHAGIHFNAILGWLAVVAMLINVASGLTGKFLLDRSRRRLEEARKAFRDDFTASLFTIADDVKIQVEFNPALVSEYRLIGYETRALARADFTNDAVDAGDVGAGHTVTALYEITRTGAKPRIEPGRYEAPVRTDPDRHPGELAWVKLRWKQPGAGLSESSVQPVLAGAALDRVAAADADTRFAVAVAAFGQWLRQDAELRGYGIDAIAALAQGARGADADGRRAAHSQIADRCGDLRQHIVTKTLERYLRRNTHEPDGDTPCIKPGNQRRRA